MGVAHHANYFIWFEAGRTEYTRAVGLPYREVEAGGLELILQPPRMAGPDAGEQLQHPERRDRVTRVFGPAQHAQQVLHMRRLEELEPAVLHERDVAPPQLDLE